MFNKKIFAIILSAVILSGAISIAAYKIFTKNQPSSTAVDPQLNFQSIVDSIDYSENLLDSNEVYKERFSNDLTSQGKWIPVKQSDLIRELTSPVESNEAPVYQNVSNEAPAPETTSLANDKSSADNDETFTEEVSTTNITSANIQPEKDAAEIKTVTEKIIYIWQPNECNEISWNPYTNGHWEFTYAGWVWASDYRWGRHCYNYGRWMWTSFAGWVWMPGSRWAPNWVTWRYCNNYNGGSYYGWYPTCPVVYWTNPNSHLIVCNSHFVSNPIHWTIVPTPNLTTKVTKYTAVDPTKNHEILNGSKKIKVTNEFTDKDTKIKYNGPSVTEVTKITKTPITPKYIDLPMTKYTGSQVGTTSGNGTTTEPGPVKIKQTKSSDEVVPIKSNGPRTYTGSPNTTKNEVAPSPVKQPTTQTPIIKNAGPSVNPPVKNTSKTDPPAQNLPPTTKTTTKTETPKQDPPTTKTPKQEPTTKTPKQDQPVKQPPPPIKQPPPVKQPDPPKYDPPKYDPPPVKQPDPPKYDPPKYDPPPVKNDPPPPPAPKQDPPKQDPPKQDPPKKDDGQKGN